MKDLTDFQKQLLWNLVHGPFEARVSSPDLLYLANNGYLKRNAKGSFLPTAKGKKIPK